MKKKRYNQGGSNGGAAAAVREQPMIYDQGGNALVPSAMVGSFQGAEWSRDRGYVYMPTLDSRKEVDQWSREELARRARFIYNSGGGLIHRCVNGVARMVCGTGLAPHPLTKNREWNQRARRLFMQRCGSPNTFDLSRKYDFFSAQRAIVRSLIRDGDCAGVIARNDAGRLRCMLYESNQIGSGLGWPRGHLNGNWQDGVLLDSHNGALAYRILGEDSDGKPTETDVPAENVLFVANLERIGQARGLTRFYPVLNKVLDRGEIMAALTKGIKQSANVGHVIEQEMAQAGSTVPGAPGSPILRPTSLVQMPDGRTVTVEKFFGGGEALPLGAGQKYKLIQPANPHENVSEYLETLVRDVAHAIGCFPEALWNVSALGGANTRFVMADTQSFIEEEQELLVEKFCGPWYVAWVMDMIEAGELEYPGDDWMLHTWLAPARLTVDFGRDGKLHLEQLKRGCITMKSLYGFRGEEWQVEVDQYLDERQYVTQGVIDRKIQENGVSRSMTRDEAFPEIGKAQPAAAVELEEEEDEDPLKKKAAK